jgi:hypothetical protein
MTMTKVESSCINSIGYDKEQKEIYVEFKNGRTYKYGKCSEQLYETFMNSPSKGQFHNDYLYNVHCTRVN